MGYVPNDTDVILFKALSAELTEVRAMLKRFQYGNVQREIRRLNEKACSLQRKLETLQARFPVRLG